MEKHEFSAMEEFLIDFSKKHSKKRLFQLDLEEYFEKNPLERDSYKKIKAALQGVARYDVICAKYGIETEKLTPEEYAAKTGISEKKAKKFFDDGSKWFSKDLCIKLYYMAVKPEGLRRHIFEAQFELHQMMKAYDELTGKNTAKEHSVGVCDGPIVANDLFKAGYDTLEEIQRSIVSGSIKDDRYGELLRLHAHAISETLTEYNLENDTWRGAMWLVSSNPRIYAVDDYTEVKIFFHPKRIKVLEHAVTTVLNGLVYNGTCSGYNIDRINNGDIWIYFNPAKHDVYLRRCAIEKVVEVLAKTPNFTEEDKED